MRGWLLLLCVFLFVWEPMKFASQLTASIGTLSMRGPYAVGELLAHGVVAALAVGAGWALWIRNPHAPGFAVIALAASAAAAVQSHYWSLLPSNTMPGDRLPLSLVAVAHAAVWIAYLRRSGRVRELYD